MRKGSTRRSRGSGRQLAWLLGVSTAVLSAAGRRAAVQSHATFVGSNHWVPVRHAQGRRGVVVRAAQDDDPEELLRKAAQLKEEAEAEKALLEARRRLQAQKDAARQEEDKEAMKKEAIELQQQLEETSVKLRKAEAFVMPERDELRVEVTRIERRLQEIAKVASKPPSTPSTPTGEASSGGGAAPKPPSGEVKLTPPKGVPVQRSGTWPDAEKMSKSDWIELERRFEEMNFFEQFQTNQKLGPQGRRKLRAMREGQEGVFIVPGETVKLIEDSEQFKQSFRRFKPGSLNGFNPDKDARRGQDCTIMATWRDGTFACTFSDGYILDFPWESVAGFNLKECGLDL
eukprot:CAMPEP_0178405592 /NCGR_PEP_ID=MMETSP0689_2-20121128/18479_1 /TAXON_ID=160604 /ORGANISM="Amphidinium massartii, Strain CS-259" /LENGTH=343 /DNA_ID=CAMNT_0020026613 /DNA_START=25 /DNA_END=1056 /DNA_ORIENTATION=-